MLPAACAALLLVLAAGADAQLLFGCKYDGALCLDGEQCVEDNLFGQCQPAGAAAPSSLELDAGELRVIGGELERLHAAGADWADAATQCTVAYFVFTVRYRLPYDGHFCDVGHPENIWALVHSVQGHFPPEAVVPAAADDYDDGGDAGDSAAALGKRYGEADESIASPAEGATVGDDAIDAFEQLDGGGEQVQVVPIYDEAAYADDADYNEWPAADYDYDMSAADGGPPAAYVLEPIAIVDVPDGDHADIGDRALAPADTVVNQVLSELQPVQQVAEPLYEVVPVEQDDYAPPDDDDPTADKRAGYEYYYYEDDPVLLNPKEEHMLNDMLVDVMNGGKPNLEVLSDEQLDKFISYVELMQQMIAEDEAKKAGLVGALTLGTSKRDYEGVDGSAMPETSDEQMWLLKKDLERLGDIDQGLNTKHKIVKGTGDFGRHQIERIEGDRVYIKLSKNLGEDREHLFNLVNYLERQVARPMNMTFSDFSVSGPEISFKVTPLTYISESEGQMLPVSGVASAVYKRRQSVHEASGADVVETGVGNDDSGHVVVARGDRLLSAVLAVCVSLGAAVVIVAGAFLYRRRAEARRQVDRLAHDVEAAPSKAYEELCRQRMAKGQAAGGPETVEPIAGVGRACAQHVDAAGDRHSSTSSWSEEPVASSTNMDISTGHMILAYLEEHLRNAAKLDEEWTTLALHQPDADKEDTAVARCAENHNKNRKTDVLPYEHTRVQLKAVLDNDSTGYVNASALHDADPRAPLYIATQAPLPGTTADFWQMIWEQGSVIIVNLTRLSELTHRYWPEGGNQVHGIFDVHLVSEHIWCEDYLVRSFYLKNLRTNETRTVTQFHYLTWPEGGVPPSTKALLEFRRKVNKSYRGRSSPVVVHCSDGTGRTGTYCLLDMVLNRISKGVKEIDIAATLEHMLDQRAGLVGSKAQYEAVLTCVADEIQAILRALANAPPAQ